MPYDHEVGSPPAPGAPTVGEGPIERLLLLVQSDRLSPEEAAAQAQSDEIMASLTSEYVESLCAVAEFGAARGVGEPALQLLDLTLAAAEAAGPADSRLSRRCKMAFIEVAHSYLLGIPDGRVYRRAMQYGEELLGDPEVRGDALHRLGTMNLDPYSADRSTEGYREAHQRWLQRAPTGPGGFPIPNAEMPEPAEALRRADDLLRQAAELRSGAQRGASRKARVEALMMLQAIGERVDESMTESEARAALTELDWQDAADRLSLLNTLRVLGKPYDAAEVEVVFERSLDEWRHQIGPAGTANLVIQAYLLLRDERPQQALQLLVKARSLAPELKDEARVSLLRAEVTMLSTYLHGAPADPPRQAPVLDVASDLIARSEEEGWDVERLFSALLEVAVSAPATDEEEMGLKVTAAARERAPLIASLHSQALDWLDATQRLGIGVNGVNGGDLTKAVHGYVGALAAFLELELPGSARECLERIDDVVRPSGQDSLVSLAFARGLAPVALDAEQTLGDPASALVRSCVERILGSLPTNLDEDSLLFLYQLAKGLRFATALYGGSRYRWSEDDESAALLEAIAQAEREASADSDVWQPLDENVLLADYEPPPMQEGDRGRLARLRVAFDERVWTQLLAGAVSEQALWLRVRDIQSALGERTALLSYFLGLHTPDRQGGIGVLVITREDLQGYLIPQEAGGTIVIDGRPLPSWLGIGTRITREGVMESPGPDLVSTTGAAALAGDYVRYLGDGQLLSGLRDRGIDHLCVVPHRSLHFHPLHLAGPHDQPLAEEWIVTYLPNLHLFVSRRGLPAARRHRDREITSIGLGFGPGNPHGLPTIDRAVSEAAAVASVFGEQPLAEAEATEEALSEALERSRFVHISTHGRHDADAPAFQCLFLTPSESSAGRLHAHDLLSLDLRGLDLVTLSACETALGRFDAADNLRGLPAALLLSGASTLIGTLWEVDADAAERFFTALYSELHDGSSCLDAFRAAQVTTRVDYPQYRDWGAFYLAGDWEW